MESYKPVEIAFKRFESVHGVEEKNPIIFLHGLGASKEHWMDIPQKVADATNRIVYAIDARNHGDTVWNDDFNFDLNVVDLMHFIDYIQAEKVILVGHSMGGITCMKAALKSPTKLEKIVVEDAGVKIPKDVLGLIKIFFSLGQASLSNIPQGSTKEDATKFIGEFVYQRIPEEIKSFVNRHENIAQDILKQNADGSFTFKSNFKALAKALENEKTLSSEFKGVYDGPSCFIYGVKSPFVVNQQADMIKNYFPKAEFVGIENALHGVHTDEPQPFTEALIKFLNE